MRKIRVKLMLTVFCLLMIFICIFSYGVHRNSFKMKKISTNITQSTEENIKYDIHVEDEGQFIVINGWVYDEKNPPNKQKVSILYEDNVNNTMYEAKAISTLRNDLLDVLDLNDAYMYIGYYCVIKKPDINEYKLFIKYENNGIISIKNINQEGEINE